MPLVKEKPPPGLHPYIFHGIDLHWGPGDANAVGDCPWCGREGKFSVEIETGLWKCWVCQAGSPEGGGNLDPWFINLLWDESAKATNGDSDVFAAERGLLHPETLTHWGVVKSIIDGSWLVPGFDLDGKLRTLYVRRWSRQREGWQLFPTPGLHHGLHGMPLFDPSKETIHLHESWGNALAFWEVLRSTKRLADGSLAPTAAEASSLVADANVLAVANCGAVGKSFERFLPLFGGKRMVLWFDSDRPTASGKPPAGMAACVRAAGMLARSAHPPASIEWLKWGEEGFDPDLPEGHDVRDELKGPLGERIKALGELLERVEPVPSEWLLAPAASSGGGGLWPEPCETWADLVADWQKAIEWFRVHDDVLSVMYAVAISTVQKGEQLFLQVIGDPGSCKTKLCEAMLTSANCFSLEHLTGFHSGWKDNSGEDFSLISRINRKTLITPEGDVLISSPKFVEIMSQQRRIFDGTSGATFKNRKEDLRHTNLRTPWIMAGTPALLDADQSRLGDRFLKVVMDKPSHDEEMAILMRCAFGSFDSVAQESNCEMGSILSDRMQRAYRKSGGYVDYLRENSTRLLAAVTAASDLKAVSERCIALARFVADMRARPNRDKRKDEHHDVRELPSRLTIQFARLATCLAAVLNKPAIDGECMRRVRKVAFDTASGRTLNIVRALAPAGEVGLSLGRLSERTGQAEDRERSMLVFLRSIGVVDWHHVPMKGFSGKATFWRLTRRFAELFEEVS